jgi:hypothetical protein
LHFGKKLLCDRGVFVIIHRGGVDVGYLLIKAALAEADFSYFRKKVFKIVFVKKSGALPQLKLERLYLSQ